MINENQQNQSTDAQDQNHEFISTVTDTVLQTLKASGQISGESREYRNSKMESKTVDLMGMFFAFWKDSGSCWRALLFAECSWV